MFIPRSAPFHENLSTSFVLVDGLVEDLCEGGFSGIVELLLRQADCAIVMANGSVVAAIESQDGAIRKSNLGELSARARSERGRVSVYRCSAETAAAIAGRMFSESLYNRLSTEFADLDKMISKLGREKDREWFVDIETGAGLAGLVHIKDHQFRAVTSNPEAAEGTRALQKLLEECKKSGATFDVYYRHADEPLDAVAELAPEPEPQLAEADREELLVQPGTSEYAVEQIEERASAPEKEVAQVVPEYPMGVAAELSASGLPQTLDVQSELFDVVSESIPSEPGPIAVAAAASASAGEPDLSLGESEPAYQAVELSGEDDVEGPGWGMTAESEAAVEVKMKAEPEVAGDGFAGANKVPKATRLLGPDEVAMFEVKRQMAEIASTIENAARVIEPRDTFSIYLRAGQLKIADRYPFLDPFGNEFEYIAGEIVFVGEEKPEVFVEGLTEALRLAVISIVEASAQPANLRTRIEDELYSLLEKERPSLQRFGLDSAIENIIG